jgi:hypothetical protein
MYKAKGPEHHGTHWKWASAFAKHGLEFRDGSVMLNPGWTQQKFSSTLAALLQDLNLGSHACDRAHLQQLDATELTAHLNDTSYLYI